MLNDFSFLIVILYPCSQNVVTCSQTEFEEMLYFRGFREFPTGFDSLIPCSWRVGKLVKRVLFGSFDLTGSVTDHIKSVKMGGKTSIFLSFVLKQS